MPIRGKERSQSSKVRVNKEIRAREVRVIGPNSEQFGIMSPYDANKKAAEFDLDLVEVAPTSNPPVCRVMDYGKHKYELSKKERALKAHQKGGHLKEVKFRPRTGDHDLEFKINHAKAFLQDRNKVKVTLMFRGREMAYRQQGWDLLAKIGEMLKELGQAESPPKMEGRNMMMIIAPKSQKEHK
ncbi:MAG: translation initiation factor IF-3 [Nitrospiria bacterium]